MNGIKGQLFHQRLIPWVPVAHLLQCDSFPNHSSEFSAGLLPTASPLLPNSSGLAHTCSGREVSRFQTGARQRPSHLRCLQTSTGHLPPAQSSPRTPAGPRLRKAQMSSRTPSVGVGKPVHPRCEHGAAGVVAGPPLPATLLGRSQPRHSRPLAFSS